MVSSQTKHPHAQATTKHILTKRNDDGGFDAVGMNNRTCVIDGYFTARKQAQAWANEHQRDVRFQSWRESRFYADEKPDAQEIIKPSRTHTKVTPNAAHFLRDADRTKAD